MGGQLDQWPESRLWVVMFGFAVFFFCFKLNSEQVGG